MAFTNYKVSFCTVCMDRLQHLKQTLLVNLRDNDTYENLEVVLLDYNSDLNVEKYIMDNFSDQLNCGRLVYYKTFTPQYFNRSHSRNLAFKLATGDIICNIDADNFTGKNFASYVNDEFNKNEKIFLSAMGNEVKVSPDVLGRICVWKDDFYSVGGYDERMVSYGFEDYDFANRLELYGVAKHSILKNIFLKAISHKAELRLNNEYLTQQFDILLFNYLNPLNTEFIFLLKNRTFIRGIIVDNRPLWPLDKSNAPSSFTSTYAYSFLMSSYLIGHWQGDDEQINLAVDNKLYDSLALNRKASCFFSRLNSSNSNFYKLTDTSLIQKTIMLVSQISNRTLMERNLVEKRSNVNDGIFGRDIVFKNFNYKYKILV